MVLVDAFVGGLCWVPSIPNLLDGRYRSFIVVLVLGSSLGRKISASMVLKMSNPLFQGIYL